MSIEKKSIGCLIDELFTTNLKCWFQQEIIMSSTDEKKIAIAAKKAQEYNARRNALIRSIDKRLGESDISPTDKTYA